MGTIAGTSTLRVEVLIRIPGSEPQVVGSIGVPFTVTTPIPRPNADDRFVVKADASLPDLKSSVAAGLRAAADSIEQQPQAEGPSSFEETPSSKDAPSSN
ncbi:hypothetical protein [Leifsonia sp. WHRI 6310E]|uniref:hypothetical protein n=1 Tax=Leifsonia sp. WHRI 6310E TaxID=3162562 RepID=UPI0032ED5129